MATRPQGVLRDDECYDLNSAAAILGRGGREWLKHAIETGMNCYRNGEGHRIAFTGYQYRMWLEQQGNQYGQDRMEERDKS